MGLVLQKNTDKTVNTCTSPDRVRSERLFKGSNVGGGGQLVEGIGASGEALINCTDVDF